jgi:hypothetical protein
MRAWRPLRTGLHRVTPLLCLAIVEVTDVTGTDHYVGGKLISGLSRVAVTAARNGICADRVLLPLFMGFVMHAWTG